MVSAETASWRPISSKRRTRSPAKRREGGKQEREGMSNLIREEWIGGEAFECFHIHDARTCTGVRQIWLAILVIEVA